MLHDTKFVDAYFNRGVAHALSGEFSDAMEDLTKVHDLSPKASDAYHARGLILERMHKVAEAKECYAKALELNPDFKPRGDALEQIRRDDIEEGEIEAPSESELLRAMTEAAKAWRDLFPERVHENTNSSREEEKPAEPPLIEIVGLYERWTRLQEVVILPLKYHDQKIYQARIVRSSRGILIYGPPGCGKTLTVLHLTREGNIAMLKVSLADTLNMWVGESEKRLKAVFDEAISRAKKGERVLIFIDEVDALGFARGGGPDKEASWNRHLLATFLSCFDDIQPYPNIAVVGATNDPFNVDGALRRPGRLGGTTLYIPPPDEVARRELFQLYIRDTPLEDDVNLQRLAERTKWYSGDDIRKICRDVHLKIAPSIAEGKPTKATMIDYLEIIRTTPISTLQWFLDIQRRLAGGLIDEMLLDKDLKRDLTDFAMDHGSRDNPSFAVR